MPFFFFFLTTFANFSSAKTRNRKSQKSESDQSSKRRLNFFRRHFSGKNDDVLSISGTNISKNAPFLLKLCVQRALMANELLFFMGQVWFHAPSCSLGLSKVGWKLMNFLFSPLSPAFSTPKPRAYGFSRHFLAF